MPFIWTQEQKINKDLSFRKLVSSNLSVRKDGFNRWYLFRKTIQIEKEIHTAISKITVDGRYQLFINKQRIRRGPIRCDPEFQRYDEIDLAPYLKKGSNVIGLLVHVYGQDTAWYQQSQQYWQKVFGDGVVYFESQICFDNEEKQLVQSDESWQYLNVKAWDSNTSISGWGQDFIEKFDAKKWPLDWLDENYDSCQWKSAKLKKLITSENEKKMGWNDISPFPVLVKNNLKPLVEAPVYPHKVLCLFQVKPDISLPFEDRIYEEEFSQIEKPNDYIKDIENMLHDNERETVIEDLEGNDFAITIEFDKRYSGFPFIELDAEGDEIIEVAVSETLPGEYSTKGITEKRIRLGTHLDCKHLFVYKARSGLQQFEKFEWTAVKYLVVVIRNINKALKIKRIGVNSILYPLENEGDFNCSDDMLNQLWLAGRYTTLLCSHDAWEDCPGREKRQWIGDGLIHYPVAQVCFGNSGIELDQLYLQQAAESQRTDGLLQMFAPGDHHYHGMVIPDFSLHWISTLYQYLWVTDDKDTVIDLFPTVLKILQWFYLQLNDRGLIANMPHWHFIEWANMGRDNEATTINALFAGALKHSIFIADYIGFSASSEKISVHYANIKRVLNEQHWDEQRGVYIDSVDADNNTQNNQVSQHANALMIYYELAPVERWQRMIDYITDPERTKLTYIPPMVMTKRAFNATKDVVQCNTYYTHFLYGALVKIGKFQQVLDQIRENYTPMIATGTSTLWESFTPDASLCHAFSASPVYYLSKEILGIDILSPGATKVVLAPQLCDLQKADGRFPTVKGNIEVSWIRDENQITIDITLPKGIEASLKLPDQFMNFNEEIILKSGRQQLKLQAINKSP